MYLQQFLVDGLGCASYLLGCEETGAAAVVDPERDVQNYIDTAAAHGLSITHIFETHLHADHISGGVELAARTGAQMFIHQAAQAEYPHRPLRDGDTLNLGTVRVTVRHTPGHTPESVTLLVSDTARSDQPWMALTGDLLFVGDVGRPDLVSAEAARGLARDLYHSLFDNLLREGDHLLIYPGHGAGSLCGRAISSVPSSTLGYEKRFNPALSPCPEGDFVAGMTTHLPEQPGNSAWIKAANRRGARPMGRVTPQPVAAGDALSHLRRGAVLLDTRSKTDYVAGHVRGALHLPAGDQLSSRVGFVLSPEIPLLLLVTGEDEYRQVVYSLARVGFEKRIGCLEDGIRGWAAHGLPVVTGEEVHRLPPREVQALREGGPVQLVDVREPWEYQEGHAAGARLIPLGDLYHRIDELDPDQPVAVMCHTGNRSQTAAALLAQRGLMPIYLVQGGMTAWEQAGLAAGR